MVQQRAPGLDAILLGLAWEVELETEGDEKVVDRRRGGESDFFEG